MKFTNLKVSSRLGLGFGLVLSLLLVLVAVGALRLNSLNKNLIDISEDRIPKLELSNAWIYELLETARHTRNILIMDDDASKKKEFDAITENKRLRKEYMEHLDKEIRSQAGRDAFNLIVESRAAYVPLEDEFLKLAATGDMEGAKAQLLQKMRPAQLAYIAAIKKFIEFEGKIVGQKTSEAKTEYLDGLTAIMAVGIVAILLGVAATIVITRSLVRQLGGEPNQAVAAANAIAAGDLTVDIQLRHGDNDSLMYAIKSMRSNLADIVTQVRSGTDTIATASSQIASGNMDLSARTERQAGALEETASSMEELTSTIKHNSEHARQANQLAISASDVAIQGGQVVSQVVDTMASINDSSKKIVDIIAVIDGIAFQTNILALNAAVEAARAGEQGRGFAVVATEVRNLAQRSAAAAKEIKGLIGDSVEKVAAGSKLVDQAGKTMEEIVVSVKRVTDVMTEISAATHEQEAGINQINQAVADMDNVTQQNAALVEEAAAASQSMQEQAGSLADVVSVFKLTTRAAQYLPPKSRVSQMQAINNPVPEVATKPQRAQLKAVRAAAPRKVANSTVTEGVWEEF